MKPGTYPAIHLVGYDPKAASEQTSLDASGPSKTQQSMRDETDVNVIVQRFGLTLGMASQFAEGGVFGDFTGIEDFEDAAMKVNAATAAFNDLPPELRRRFGNNPGKFISYVDSLEPHQWDALAAQEPKPAPEPVKPPVPQPTVVTPQPSA